MAVRYVTLLMRLPQYWTAQRFGWPNVRPINITLNLLYACNSRCLTCNIWKKVSDRLTVEEYQKIFASIGQGPVEIILTGGEPFLREDLAEVCRAAVRFMRVPIIIIPTNGLLTERIVRKVRDILDALSRTELVINVSIDDIGEADDRIRGVPGAYRKAVETYRRLREIESDHLELKVHTVVSRFNVDHLADVYDGLRQEVGPIEWICEIAEERFELDTIGADITPSADDYERAMGRIIRRVSAERRRGLGRLTQAFRIGYYDLVERILRQKRQVIPCYAAWASCEISPNGDVWACCVRGGSLGNLRETGYDFSAIWQSPKAKSVRRSIRRGECYCPLANAAYTNMLLHLPSLVKAAFRYLRRG